MIDGGKGKDRYGFGQSTGLGGADHAGWGLFIEEGGSDQYQVKSGFGHSSEQGMAGFFDLNGKDSYSLPPEPVIPPEQQPADGKVILYPKGGLFVDR